MLDAGKDGTFLKEPLNHVLVVDQLRTKQLERQWMAISVSAPPHLSHGAATDDDLEYV